MASKYRNLSEIAKHNGVSAAAVTGWTKKGTWPKTLDRKKVDQFISEFITPHRRGAQKNLNPTPARLPPLSPHPQSSAVSPPVAIAAAPADIAMGDDALSLTLEQLESRIRSAPNSDTAERLSKQVRALKVVREIRQQDGQTVDAAATRAEIQATLHFFRTTLTNLPRALAPVLEGQRAEEIETILSGRLAEVIGELKRGLECAIDAGTNATALEGDGKRARDPGKASPEPNG